MNVQSAKLPASKVTMAMRKSQDQFPFEFIFNEDTTEVLVRSSGMSFFTAMGLPSLVRRHFPGYKSRLCSKEYFDTLKSELSGAIDRTHPQDPDRAPASPT
jgi:hypothetical protein